MAATNIVERTKMSDETVENPLEAIKRRAQELNLEGDEFDDFLESRMRRAGYKRGPGEWIPIDDDDDDEREDDDEPITRGEWRRMQRERQRRAVQASAKKVEKKEEPAEEEKDKPVKKSKKKSAWWRDYED